MSLLGLPIELFNQIALEIHRDDIENFCLCNRAVFQQMEAGLKTHRRRKRLAKLSLYLSRRSPANDETFVGSRIDEFFIALSQDPGIAAYIVELRLVDAIDDPSHNYELDEAETLNHYDSTLVALQKPSRRAHLDCMEYIKELLENGHTGAMTILLLAILPNLERLVAVDFYSSFWGHQPTLGPPGFLNHLTTLELVKSNNSMADRGYVDLVKILSGRPEVKNLRLRSLYGASDGFPPDFISSLEQLQIERCNISVEDYSRVFQPLKSLKKLQLCKSNVCERTGDSSPARLISVLAQTVYKTLEYLELTPNYSLTLGFWPLRDSVGSFKPFEVLKVLKVTKLGVFKPPFCDKEQRYCRECLDQMGPEEELCHHWANQLDFLVHELPPSLEKLVSVGLSGKLAANGPFSGLKELKHERLPNFQEIVFNDDCPMERA